MAKWVRDVINLFHRKDSYRYIIEYGIMLMPEAQCTMVILPVSGKANISFVDFISDYAIKPINLTVCRPDWKTALRQVLKLISEQTFHGSEKSSFE